MIRRMFIDHPQSVNESYFEHMRFALGFAGLLFAASLAALLHAIFPAMFEKTASGLVTKLYARIHNR